MLARDTSLQQRCTMPRFIHGEHLPERTEAMQRARSNQPPSRSKCSKTVARRHHSDDCKIPVFGSTPTKRASNGSENRGHWHRAFQTECTFFLLPTTAETPRGDVYPCATLAIHAAEGGIATEVPHRRLLAPSMAASHSRRVRHAGAHRLCCGCSLAHGSKHNWCCSSCC